MNDNSWRAANRSGVRIPPINLWNIDAVVYLMLKFPHLAGKKPA